MLNFRPSQTSHLSGFQKTASELTQAMGDIIQNSRPAPPPALVPPTNHIKQASAEKTADELEVELMNKLASTERGLTLIKVSDVYGRLLAQLEVAQAAGNEDGVKTAEANLADFVTVSGPELIKRATSHDKSKHPKAKKEEKKEESHEAAPSGEQAPPQHQEAPANAGPSVY